MTDAGTVLEVKPPFIDHDGYAFYQFDITADGSGNVVGTTGSQINGLVEAIVISNSSPTPTASWDLYLQSTDMNQADYAATNFYGNAAIGVTYNTVARIAFGSQNGFPCRSKVQVTALAMGAGGKARVKLYYKI